MLKPILLILLTLAVVGCADSSPYKEGRSPADIPAHINVVNLKKVYMIEEGGMDQVSLGASGDAEDTPPAANPSQNDQEVTALAKANIISQLTNFGYRIVEGDNVPSDIAMKYFVNYQPERWPLVGRWVSIVGHISAPDGKSLLTVKTIRANQVGLIGAAVGPSRDDMVAAAAREAVVKTVTEIRKGTKDNAPVAQTSYIPSARPQ